MRASAFAGVPLDMVLREYDAETLILCGIATSGVVLSTLREACDRDYCVTVLRDCCGDLDEEVHAVLMDKVFPNGADVISSSEYLASL